MNKCPIFQVADLIGKKWTIVIIQEISLNGSKGFNAMFKRLGKVSPKLLSRRLKELESKGIVKKELITTQIPIKTRYNLTEKGKELKKIIDSLKFWCIKHSKEKLECNIKECISCPLY